MGIQLSIAVKYLADKYRVSTRQIYLDWKSRDSWMGFFLDSDEGAKALLDINSRYEFIYAQAYRDYTNSRNDSARVGMLRVMMECTDRRSELLILKPLIRDVEELKGVNLDANR